MRLAEKGDPLSSRERQVLKRLALGATYKEIAAMLHLSVTTIPSYTTNLYVKLGVRGRGEAAAYYWQNIHEFGDVT